jgi:hypothetical protein
VDGHADTVDIHRADAELGLFVVLAQAVQQFVARGHALGELCLAEGRQGVAVELGRCLRKVGERLHQGALGLVEGVQHGAAGGVMLQCNIAAVAFACSSCKYG